MMNRVLTNTFTLSLLLLLIFRLGLWAVFGPNRDGNFLILVVVPLVMFMIIVYLGKKLFHKKVN